MVKLLILLVNIVTTFCFLNYNKYSLILNNEIGFKNKDLDKKNIPNVKIKKSNKYSMPPGWMEKEAKIFDEIVKENQKKIKK